MLILKKRKSHLSQGVSAVKSTRILHEASPEEQTVSDTKKVGDKVTAIFTMKEDRDPPPPRSESAAQSQSSRASKEGWS